MKPLVSLRDALADPELLGLAIPGDSWRPWRILLIAAMGEPLDPDERPIFEHLTGRTQEPLERVEEFWGIAGRRSGKTRAVATLGGYLATLCEHSEVLAPGERAVLPLLAASTSQAGRAFMHLLGVLQHSPVLNGMIVGEPTSDTIRLSSRVDVEVAAANFRTVRSITAVAAIADEVAFWQTEGARNPDAEILGALRPALATTGGPLIVISSPHARRGELFEAYRRHHGPAGDPLILIAKAASRTLNSTLPQRVVDRAYELDAARASAEYGGEFRSDVEVFLNLETVEACVDHGVFERPRKLEHRYKAFCDPSGGAADAMTLAVGHKEGDEVVMDALRVRKPPFSPMAVVAEFCDLLKSYGVHSVTGDRYAGEWPREQFRKLGVSYDLADKTKSDLYRDLLPALNSRRALLLDNQLLVDQLVGLERRVARGGRESIDHAPMGHDDVANAAAGVISLCRTAHAPVQIMPFSEVLGMGRRRR